MSRVKRLLMCVPPGPISFRVGWVLRGLWEDSLIGQLHNWIQFFFWVRKQPEWKGEDWVYSKEFTNTLRYSAHYGTVSDNWVFVTYMKILCKSIEEYHNYRNEIAPKYNLPHLRLDGSSDEIQERISDKKKREG